MTTTADDVTAADFDGFYRAHYSETVALTYGFTGDHAEAQDIAQEAFSRAWLRWPSLSSYDNPVYWVRRVAANLAHSRWRRLKVAAAYLVQQRLEAVPDLSPDSIDIVNALKRLPVSQRTAIGLHYFVDMPLEDVAAELGVPVNTVKSWLRRGRTALSAQLAVEISRATVTPPASGLRDAAARKQSTRRISAAAAAAAAIITAGMLVFGTIPQHKPQPPATPAPWLSPVPTPSPLAAEPPFPSTCIPSVLSAPDELAGANISFAGADLDGRLIVGRAKLSDHTRFVVWQDGQFQQSWYALRDDVELVRVNRSGTLVLTSSQQGEPGPVHVYSPELGIVLLSGKHAVAEGISSFGLVVGQVDRRPVFWRSPRAEPEFLPMPDGAQAGIALGVTESGVIVGTVRRTEQLSWGKTAGSLVAWYPDGTFRQFESPESADGVLSVAVRGEWAVAHHAKQAYRWHLRTGQMEELPAGLHTFNSYGWGIASFSEGTDLVSGTSRVRLDTAIGDGVPVARMASVGAVADDGRTVTGSVSGTDNEPGYSRVVQWACRP